MSRQILTAASLLCGPLSLVVESPGTLQCRATTHRAIHG